MEAIRRYVITPLAQRGYAQIVQPLADYILRGDGGSIITNGFLSGLAGSLVIRRSDPGLTLMTVLAIDSIAALGMGINIAVHGYANARVKPAALMVFAVNWGLFAGEVTKAVAGSLFQVACSKLAALKPFC